MTHCQRWQKTGNQSKMADLVCMSLSAESVALGTSAPQQEPTGKGSLVSFFRAVCMEDLHHEILSILM